MRPMPSWPFCAALPSMRNRPGMGRGATRKRCNSCLKDRPARSQGQATGDRAAPDWRSRSHACSSFAKSKSGEGRNDPADGRSRRPGIGRIPDASCRRPGVRANLFRQCHGRQNGPEQDPFAHSRIRRRFPPWRHHEGRCNFLFAEATRSVRHLGRLRQVQVS